MFGVTVVILMLGLFLIMMANAFHMLNVASRICDNLLDEGNYWYVTDFKSVQTVFDYHGLSFSSWLSFKPWFYPFKPPSA